MHQPCNIFGLYLNLHYNYAVWYYFFHITRRKLSLVQLYLYHCLFYKLTDRRKLLLNYCVLVKSKILKINRMKDTEITAEII